MKSRSLWRATYSRPKVGLPMTRLLAAAHSAPRILAALAALAVAPMAQAVSTASRYVQDGLLACWDGIENAGAGDFLMHPSVTVNPDGTRTYAPVSFEDVGSFAETVFFPGDRIEFPDKPQDGYCTADDNAAAILDGSVLLCREPGVNLVSGYVVAQEVVRIATNLESTLPVVVAPRAADCPAGVWLYRNDAALTWTDPTAWVHV